jgi:hypothetical protein
MSEKKPGRPFGVTLAILLGVMIYTIFPLVNVGYVLLIENHFRQIDQTVIPGQIGMAASGGDFRGGITDAQIVIQVVVALLFLVVAVMTWRGKPPAMRWVFMAAVLGWAIFSVAMTVITQSNTDTSGGSLDALGEVLDTLRLSVTSLLVPLYVVWYLNRGPARAFFRGYYLDPKAQGTTTPEYDNEPVHT